MHSQRDRVLPVFHVDGSSSIPWLASRRAGDFVAWNQTPMIFIVAVGML